MNKARQKRIEKGEKLYEDFVSKINESFEVDFKVSNPRSSTAELFHLLNKDTNHKDFLLTEMMKEYITNFVDVKFSVAKGRIYEHYEIRAEF